MADALDLAIARPIAFDFNKLADPFQGYAQGQAMRADNQAQKALAGGLPRGPDGSIDFGAAVDALAKAGAPPQTIAQFAQLASSASDRTANRDIQRQNLQLHQEQFKDQQRQNPWQVTATGMQPTPGGAADPAYLAAKEEASRKPQKMSLTDIGKLSEEGGHFQQSSRFGDTFKPEFAGYKNQTLGDMAMSAGRIAPELASKVPGLGDVKEASQWWQEYDRYKNEARHKLFGSALTKNEQAAFEKADISPGMSPDQIKVNLQRQRESMLSAMQKKAGGAIEAGYDADVFAKAYGVTPQQLGVAPKAKPAAAPSVAPAAAPAGPPRINSPQEYANLPSGAPYMAPDGSLRTKR